MYCCHMAKNRVAILQIWRYTVVIKKVSPIFLAPWYTQLPRVSKKIVLSKNNNSAQNFVEVRLHHLAQNHTWRSGLLHKVLQNENIEWIDKRLSS